LENAGAICEIIDLADLPKDFLFTALYENTGKNEEFNVFRNKVTEYEKFVFIVPEYNGSIPGALKAFVDGLKYPDSFRNKKAALVGLSAGVMGGALALSHFTDILSYLGMNVLGNRVKLMHIDQNLKSEVIENKLFNELIDTQIKELIAF
jgi:chromate reductase